MRFIAKTYIISALSLVLTVQVASAQNRAEKQLNGEVTDAMEAYDGFEYEKARKTLSRAIEAAKKSRVKEGKALANAYMHLAVVHLSGLQQKSGAKSAMAKAVAAFRNVEIPMEYSEPKLKQMLRDAQKNLRRRKPDPEPDDELPVTPDPETDEPDIADDVDCSEVKGFKHDLVENAKAGKAAKIVALVGSGVDVDEVQLHYRPMGTSSFKKTKLEAKDCAYSGEIPASAIGGEFVYYYVAVYDADGEVVAKAGSSGSPNIVEISAAAGSGSGGNVSKSSLLDDGSGPGWYFGISAGAGGGLITGTTEQTESPVDTGFAPAPLNGFLEFGKYINPQTTISAAFRMGLPLMANRAGAATLAPSVLLRVRRTFEGSAGFMLTGAIGGGTLRHAVPLDEVPMGEGDHDTTVSGPLILGVGAGYAKPLNNSWRFVAELNALAGIPIVSEIQDSEATFAVQFNANLGIEFGF